MTTYSAFVKSTVGVANNPTPTNTTLTSTLIVGSRVINPRVKDVTSTVSISHGFTVSGPKRVWSRLTARNRVLAARFDALAFAAFDWGTYDTASWDTWVELLYFNQYYATVRVTSSQVTVSQTVSAIATRNLSSNHTVTVTNHAVGIKT